MPKVTAPLFSLEASGTIADLLTFRESRRGPVVVKKSQPTGEPSISQLAIRATTKALMQIWPLLSPDQVERWDAAPGDPHLAANNKYLIENWQREKDGLPSVAGRPGPHSMHANTFSPTTFCPRTFTPTTLAGN
jgi:hypothetical protein